MKRTLQISFGLGLSLFFVWWSLRGTDLAAVAHAVRAADLRWVLAALAVLSTIHFVRAWRWGLLLKPLAPARFRDVNALAAVGFMALMLLPLRLGELARPSLAAEKLKVRMSGALASVVVERIVDGLFMGLVLVGLLWTLGAEVSSRHLARVRLGGALVALVFGAGLVALVLAFRHRDAADRLVGRLVGRFSPRLADRLRGMLASFTDGLAVVPSASRLFEFVLVTALYWGLNALGLALLARAFALHLSPAQATTVLGLQVIGAMIPAGPGMVGTMQFFTVLGASLFLHGPGVGTRIAAYAHTGWALSFGQQVAFGLYFVLIGRVRLNHLFSHLLGRGQVAPTAADEAPLGS